MMFWLNPRRWGKRAAQDRATQQLNYYLRQTEELRRNRAEFWRRVEERQNAHALYLQGWSFWFEHGDEFI